MAAIVDLLGNPGPGDPFVHAAVVTPSDTVDLAHATTALWLGTVPISATLAVVMVGGEQVTFTFGNAAALTLPVLLPIRVTRVSATGTNVTNIMALWR